MIPISLPLGQAQSWQAQLRDAITEPAVLFRRLGLDPAELPASLAASRDFALRVPEAYLSRIEPGNWADPLLRQVLPLGLELTSPDGYSDDPLAEADANPAPGLIHKYHGRVLLIVSGACAINCRYCFRRAFPYEANNPGRRDWQRALAYIAGDASISEVILSGGDPLAAPDRQLEWLVTALAAIPHVQRLRVHTRLPVVIPDRIDDSCLAWLTGSRLQPVMVLHINHPRELDAQVGEACRRLRVAGVPLLNQAVLLAEVNDNSETLITLSEALFAHGVLPYYLHLLDRVRGAAHFEVSEQRAVALMAQLRARLPGYLMPRLVREEPLAPAKTPIPG